LTVNIFPPEINPIHGQFQRFRYAHIHRLFIT
jgi:hypothetical protein